MRGQKTTQPEMRMGHTNQDPACRRCEYPFSSHVNFTPSKSSCNHSSSPKSDQAACWLIMLGYRYCWYDYQLVRSASLASGYGMV